RTRDHALDRLAAALEQTVVVGPHSNARFLAALCRAPGFRKGDFDTAFIDRHMAELGAGPMELDRAAAAFGAQKLLAREDGRIALSHELEPDALPSPWDAADGFQFSGERTLAVPVLAEGEAVVAQVTYSRGGPIVAIEGETPAQDAVAVVGDDAVYVL